ncbi:YHS domain-containing (seleno)protein [Algoriphagus litoralis]|uniref:YHS domain-containing (seleno)protein n=1 Tax=Algoriphagus litoralis TaxID=2202829 RepID=UPI000DBAD635|nr:YHS domain-containing (seleno)protein [Algoriphagus litoralis]
MKQVIVLLILLTFQSVSFAQKSEIYLADNKAIGGYDPVAYFTEKKPVKGKEEFKVAYQGANWHFSSEANKKLFVANPEKYAPQYGGYCAFGVAGGYKAKTSPDAWTIVNDKLYLNYNLNVQKDWLKDRDSMIQKANKNWATVKKN